MDYSLYYQALVSIPETWFVTATLRSFEHLTFDRTLDVEQGLFEFFVPIEMEPTFLEIMYYFEKNGIVSSIKKLDNRLQDENAEV